jgi:hypothetical protein
MEPDALVVQLKLSADEALVLFEWLSKREDDGALEPLIEHWSEQLVLWSLLGQLQKSLAEPFDPNYAQLIAAARERLVAGIAPEDQKRAHGEARG